MAIAITAILVLSGSLMGDPDSLKQRLTCPPARVRCRMVRPPAQELQGNREDNWLRQNGIFVGIGSI